MTDAVVAISTRGGLGVPTYASWSAWQTAQVGDITAAGANLAEHRVIHYDDWVDGQPEYGFSFSAGWVTDANHRIVFEGAVGENHGGVVGEGHFVRGDGGSPFYVLDAEAANPHFVLRDMQIETPAAAGSCVKRGNNGTIERTILRKTAGNAYILIDPLNPTTDITSSAIIHEGGANACWDWGRGGAATTKVYQTVFDSRNGPSALRARGGFANNIPMENCVIYADTLYDGGVTGAQTNKNHIAYKTGIDRTFGVGTEILNLVEADFVDYPAYNYTPADGQKLDDTGSIPVPATDLANVAWSGNHVSCLTIAGGPGPVTLNPDSTNQLQALDVPVLSHAYIAIVDSLNQPQNLDQVALTVAGAIALESIAQGNTLDSVTLQANYAVQVQNILQNQALQDVDLLLEALRIDSLTQQQILEEVSLSSLALVQVDNLTQAQLIETVRLGGVVFGALDGEIVCYALLDGDVYTLH